MCSYKHLTTISSMFSLCIPVIDSSISMEHVYCEFYKLNIGKINSVKIIPNKQKTQNNHNYSKAYINYDSVNKNSPIIKHFLTTDRNINVFYNNGPWFWKVYKTNS